jgi:uncharacterized FAD-dependent dehydrogenase
VPFLLRNLLLDLKETEDVLPVKIARRFSLRENQIDSVEIVRKTLDARKKGRIRFVCTVRFSVRDEESLLARHSGDADLQWVEKIPTRTFPKIRSDRKIVIIGMGPAGLFAALRLAEYGLSATILDRGRAVDERVADVRKFWSKGILDCDSNVQFGEGGAGAFSDGKLTTRVKDDNIGYALDKLIEHGAPPEIRYSGKPHVGTDRLRGVIRQIRNSLQSSGFTISFSQKVTDLSANKGSIAALRINGRDEVECDTAILAPGNSARDTFEMLLRRDVRVERKPFAVGLRIEHPQGLIDRIQYGPSPHPLLPVADYSLAYTCPLTKRAVYSFCMCPGGVVVAGSSEEGMVVTNGMSNYDRNSGFANSALVVPVLDEDLDGDGPLAGMELQRTLERKAFAAGGGGYFAPAQTVLSFLGRKGGGPLRSTYLPGVREADFGQVLPQRVIQTIRDGLGYFDGKMRGFISEEATLTGVEARTSSPVRITRGEDLQSVSVKGLYPVGEGAGYAGGIMSAALDGIRAADRIALQITEGRGA